ncbi:Uncharacterised protein [Legionella donaldsonii]|uniref:HTH cro/C1-type domain-containing protein n=1 Tax=Legionella donaldsonii TaxID=45060 RepID=A0A378KJ05_9GAMM|nr:hypothetical protein [Legionella donaldsonii]STX84898.1 Uncharacterised protein [Legionella donaldsonii]
MTNVINNTIGDRITYCRSSLCLTRKELAEKWGAASIPTLARWELDTGKIPIKKLLSLIEFFHAQGLFVTESWLKDGAGSPPLLLKSDQFDELDFDSIAQEKLLDINRQVKYFIFGQVKNNLMSPFIKYGDYMGGVNIIESAELSSLQGELIFLKKRVTGLMVGILKECINQISIKNFDKTVEFIEIEHVEALGKIQWLIRRP